MKIVAGAAIGIVFGIVISWSGMVSPEIIRHALLFEQAYLFLMFASAVATASLGLALLRRRERAALLTGDRLSYGREPVGRHHVVGSLLFGIGWADRRRLPRPHRRPDRPGRPMGGLHADRRGLRRLAVPAPWRGRDRAGG